METQEAVEVKTSVADGKLPEDIDPAWNKIFDVDIYWASDYNKVARCIVKHFSLGDKNSFTSGGRIMRVLVKEFPDKSPDDLGLILQVIVRTDAYKNHLNGLGQPWTTFFGIYPTADFKIFDAHPKVASGGSTC